MRALWWALGAAVLIFAARALVDGIRRRDREAAAEPPVQAAVVGPDTSQPTPTLAPGLLIMTKPLTGIPAIRNFFRTNTRPVYFVSATAFNLLGIDRWVRNFRFVNYYDSFDGTHPNVFVPKEQTPRAFGSIEEIVNYLLGHKDVGDLVAANGGSGEGALLVCDEETEQLAEELGLGVAFPPAELRHRMDSKIETTRLGDEADVPSVPNTMGRGTDYRALLRLPGARARGGGPPRQDDTRR